MKHIRRSTKIITTLNEGLKHNVNFRRGHGNLQRCPGNELKRKKKGRGLVSPQGKKTKMLCKEGTF